jgi:TonB family protein
MTRESMSDADPLQPLPGATSVLRARPDDASFEADFADLAARFSAQSGGGLSPELSADLALEIVLNEVVDSACTATGATGAAIVLQRDGEMVCRASSGSTAPELGSRLDTASGLSGECIKTRTTQRCGDVLSDPRVDAVASQRLGVRSVMVMPLIRDGELAGVFEVFSSLPNAFGERDERTLDVLSTRILVNLERATQPLLPPDEPQAYEEPQTYSESLASVPAVPSLPTLSEPIAEIPEQSQRGSVDVLTWALGFAVLACAVMLGVLLGRHFGPQGTTLRARRAAPTASAPTASTSAPAVGNPASAPMLPHGNASTNHDTGKAGEQQPSAVKASVEKPIPPGSLQVFENGKEVFRLPASPSRATAPEQGTGIQRAASVEPEVVELSPAAAEGSLLHRVEPEYPEDARQQRVQGAVVLDVRIGGNGSVQDVQVVSGAPPLAQASTDAVKQWRFKPRRVNGRPAEMQTRVTLNFRLPQ